MSIADNLIELNNTKQSIKAAIEGKGQNLSGVPFTGYAYKIASLETVEPEITLPYAEGSFGAVGRLTGQDSGSLKALMFRQLGGDVEFQNLALQSRSCYIAYDMGNDSWFVFGNISAKSSSWLYYIKYREGAFSIQTLSGSAAHMSSVAVIDGQLTYIRNYTSAYEDPSFRLSTIDFDENGDVVLGTEQTLENTVSNRCGGPTARLYYNGKFYVMSCGIRTSSSSYEALITKFSYNSDDDTYSLNQALGYYMPNYSRVLKAYIIADDGQGINWGYTFADTSGPRMREVQYSSTWDTEEYSYDYWYGKILLDYSGYTIDYDTPIQPLGNNDVLAKNDTTGDVVLFKYRGVRYDIVELSESLTSLFNGHCTMVRLHGESNRYMVYANTTVNEVEGIYLIIFGITGDTLTIYDTIPTTLSAVPSSSYVQMGGVRSEYIDFYQSAYSSVFAKTKRTWRENMLGFIKSINPTAQTWDINTGTVITGLNTIAGYDYYAGENGKITNIANQYYVGHCTENGNLVFKDARWGKEILI